MVKNLHIGNFKGNMWLAATWLLSHIGMETAAWLIFVRVGKDRFLSCDLTLILIKSDHMA